MTPSVGRIVHFYTKDVSKQFNGQGAGPYVAVVTQVFAEGAYCNLKVLPPFAAPYDEGSVSYDAAGGASEADRGWCWPVMPRG